MVLLIYVTNIIYWEKALVVVVTIVNLSTTESIYWFSYVFVLFLCEFGKDSYIHFKILWVSLLSGLIIVACCTSLSVDIVWAQLFYLLVCFHECRIWCINWKQDFRSWHWCTCCSNVLQSNKWTHCNCNPPGLTCLNFSSYNLFYCILNPKWKNNNYGRTWCCKRLWFNQKYYEVFVV